MIGRINKAGFVVLFLALSTGLVAQTAPEELVNSWEERVRLSEESYLNNYPATNIGPVVQGGRITDIDVNLQNKNEFYVGYASGGIFKTENNGVTFEPIFDLQGALGIGDLALAPSDPSIMYVGTGENNSSRSSYAGTGVYRTDDKGKTWSYLGLAGIHHTGRIIVHPENPDIVWVAAMGALYSNNPERGVYKTTNGGKSWDKTLYVNDSTGVIDLLIDPEDPDHLWATTWERSRKAWEFKEGGVGSSIYATEDGGKTWKKSVEGFPQGDFVGRIGIDLCKTKPNVMYALLDNQFETKEEIEKEEGKLYPADFVNMSASEFQALDNKALEDFLRSNRFPGKYTAQSVKKDVSEGKYEPVAVAEFTGNANDDLFNTSIKGAELYRSEDYGKSWEKVNVKDIDGMYFTYGYYFGEVRVDPNDEDLVYVFGVPLLKSTDGGAAFHRLDTVGNVHVDHHALWIDPADSKHLLLGNDGGLYISYDEGANWLHMNNMSVGQFYTVNVDMQKPYNVYGGLQDNGVKMGSSRSVPNRTRKWETISGGDGMFVIADPRDHNLVYSGSQFGFYARRNQVTGERKSITPQNELGLPKLRWNWRTPVVMSSHNPDVLYMGAQRLFRSMDQGDSWQQLSNDLTHDLPQGNVPFSTITEIDESKMQFGMVMIGTDDGRVWVSKAAGIDNWQEVTAGLPERKWVSSLALSDHDIERMYVALNGYREDDFETYVFTSDDLGKTWRSLRSNLPSVVVNEIYEDPVNENLLYLGTDHGTYISMDRGQEWHLLNSIPNVSSYDMVVHPRENELIVGTHGRSIYRVDVEPLQQLAKNPSKATLLATNDIRWSNSWGESRYNYSEPYVPSKVLELWVVGDSTHVNITITDEAGTKVREMKADVQKGYNRISWDLMKHSYEKRRRKDPVPEPEYIDKGKYTVKLTYMGQESTQTFEVK